jgi:hypothetical protein
VSAARFSPAAASWRGNGAARRPPAWCRGH